MSMSLGADFAATKLPQTKARRSFPFVAASLANRKMHAKGQISLVGQFRQHNPTTGNGQESA
jgi:predicted SnoaL-like aldol condensation-catalyzing enzyme